MVPLQSTRKRTSRVTLCRSPGTPSIAGQKFSISTGLGKMSLWKRFCTKATCGPGGTSLSRTHPTPPARAEVFLTPLPPPPTFLLLPARLAVAVPHHLSLAAAILPGNPRVIPAAPDVGLILGVRHGAILHHQVRVVGLWGVQGGVWSCPVPRRAERCSGPFWGDAPSPPNPPRVPAPLTAWVEDDLQVPVVAVGLGQGDTGGGGRAGPGVSVGSQGMGRALQPCGEEAVAGQPLVPPPQALSQPPTCWALHLRRTQHHSGGCSLPALMGLTGLAAPPPCIPTSPVLSLVHRFFPRKEVADLELPQAMRGETVGVPAPGVGWGKGFFADREHKRTPRERGAARRD